ncbi:Protein-tyrosine-phosphatase [Rubrobacter radiotolerans]|uniref:protein-tyrosine-phosphatase n=1 Tax=Rubrobacter radiotolerans TaxID=42256 RepID=A0A023X4M4_RUBRA|nr:low molecular weight protein-tyrosine-phosphatase [Rubrobacter radiotolerans]AHY47146.1 Protein-tyrosine-phosphatase [Rubrobacter radiotolerans]MDX5894552.1 low molecular weight protein-tyrosine-phosphatase [Rubrobacter radiotolerans]SMC06238.1 protein-tyrosine phosphatase [Rubrobacter radiotolerans DSM 5868]
MSEVRVLFVCMGNICRSPVAEGVFRKLVEEAGLGGRIRVDSAGTGAWHLGHEPDERAQRSVLSRGIDISDVRARRLVSEDLDRFDYVLTMDEYNLREVRALGDGKTVVRPFMDYHPDPEVTEVPDPYYGAEDGFAEVLDLVEAASERLLEEIRRERLFRGR